MLSPVLPSGEKGKVLSYHENTRNSPIQPSWVPPNCRFELDDAEKEWTWPWNSFDFIHLRNLAQAIMDWPRLLSQAYQ